MTDSKANIRKKLIGKKSIEETKSKVETGAENDREDSLEIPVSKVIKGLVALLVIALIVAVILNAGKLKELFGSDVAATVNGEEITWSQIDKEYATVPESMKTYITREALLNQTINELVIKQEVDRRGIAIDDAYLAVMIDNVKSQFSDEESFNQALETYGTTYDELVSQLRLSLQLNKMLETDLPILKVNDSEIGAFFEENKVSLSVPEQVRASHILVNDSETAEEIMDLLKGGADFAELAKNYSIDTASATYGGELGYFGKGTMIPEFEDAAFGLEIGEVSEPIKSKFGYHIIKLTDKKPAEEAKLDEKTRALIELSLFNEKWDANKEAVNEYLAALTGKAEIKRFN